MYRRKIITEIIDDYKKYYMQFTPEKLIKTNFCKLNIYVSAMFL